MFLGVAPGRTHSKHKEPSHEGKRQQPDNRDDRYRHWHTFHLVGLDERGAIVLRQKMSRGQVVARLANMSPCLVGMEACVGAHHLSRQLLAIGHDVKLVPGQFVKPFLKGQKNRDCPASHHALCSHQERRPARPAGTASGSFAPSQPAHSSRPRPYALCGTALSGWHGDSSTTKRLLASQINVCEQRCFTIPESRPMSGS